MSNFSIVHQKHFFPQILSKKLKLIVSGEICYFQDFEYAGFDDAVDFSCLDQEYPFRGDFV